MRKLIGWLSRVVASRSRRLIAGVAALTLAVALLAAAVDPLAPAGHVLAAGGNPYASCADAIANFSTDLAGIASGSATFTFPAGCEIDLTSALTIQPGVSITIDGNGLVLKGNGTSTSPGTFDIIDVAETASSTSTLTLNDVTVENGLIGINAVGVDSAYGLGGSGGTITLTNSTVSGNAHDGVDAAGGVSTYGLGGSGGTVSLTNSTVSGNTGDGVDAGGGNSGYRGGAGGTVTLSGSTVSGNAHDGVDAGGGQSGEGEYANGADGGRVSLIDSTVSGNAGDGVDVSGSDGGGDDFEDGGSGGNGGVVTATSSTLSDNAGGGIAASGGKGAYGNIISGSNGTGGSATLTATILANSGANCAGLGKVTDDGYNLATDDSCSFTKNTSGGPVPKSGTGGINLLPLSNNGGPTQTQALGSGSIAIDAIPLSGGQCAAGEQIDQRGIPRPQGSGCDIGAYELIQGPYTVTEQSCPTQAQLQDDLDLATPGRLLTINLPPNCTINLISSNPNALPNPSPALSIGAGLNITVNGNGLTLVGKVASQPSDSYDLIDIKDQSSPTKLTLDRVTLENGLVGVAEPFFGGATVTFTNGTVTGSGFYGISASNVVVSDSAFDNGGGIFVDSSASIRNSTFVDDSYAIDASDGSTTVTGSTFSGNDTGILVSNGNFAVANSTFSGNRVGLIISTNPSATVSGMVTASTFNGNEITIVNRADPLATASITLTASILAGDSSVCQSAYQVPITDGGYNLLTDSSCGFGTTKQSQTVIATQLELLPLDNYGGPTQTVALGPGSRAIDAIPINAQGQCAYGIADASPILDPITGGPIATDQRGIDRPQGKGCDVGAYEAPAVSIITTPSGPDATTGWYNAATLGGPGKTLGVNVSFSGLATGELPECSGASVSDLPPTAVTGLNQTASGSTSFGNGTYTFSCGVWQGTTALGVSQSPAQPLTFKIDTILPTATITSPAATTYLVGQSVTATFSCGDIGSGLATTDPCAGTLGSASITSGTTLDTSSAAAGPHTLTVVATDVAGNQTTTAVSYQVEALAAPTLQINEQPAQSSPYWYNLANSANGVTLTLSDTDSQVTGYSCTDNNQSLDLNISGTPLTGAASLGDGVQTLSCTASATPATGTPSAATTVTIQVDRTPPTISSPAANASYIVNHPVTLGCADAGSGIATCAVTVREPDGATTTVSAGSDLPTGQTGIYSVTPNTVTDVAGNADTTSFTYTVSYGITPLPGDTQTVNRGYYALIRFYPVDANGRDEASRTLKVTSVELQGNGQTIPFAHSFQYGTFSGKAGYQLAINTRNLSIGSWTLVVQIGSGATATTETITFTVV